MGIAVETVPRRDQLGLRILCILNGATAGSRVSVSTVGATKRKNLQARGAVSWAVAFDLFAWRAEIMPNLSEAIVVALYPIHQPKGT